MVIFRPNLSIVNPPWRAPNTAPPLKVELMAPIVADEEVVLKKAKKFADAITSEGHVSMSF